MNPVSLLPHLVYSKIFRIDDIQIANVPADVPTL